MTLKEMKALKVLATEQGLKVESMTVKEFVSFSKSVKV